jgi:hypothetical protein
VPTACFIYLLSYLSHLTDCLSQEERLLPARIRAFTNIWAASHLWIIRLCPGINGHAGGLPLFRHLIRRLKESAMAGKQKGPDLGHGLNGQARGRDIF